MVLESSLDFLEVLLAVGCLEIELCEVVVHGDVLNEGGLVLGDQLLNLPLGPISLQMQTSRHLPNLSLTLQAAPLAIRKCLFQSGRRLVSQSLVRLSINPDSLQTLDRLVDLVCVARLEDVIHHGTGRMRHNQVQIPQQRHVVVHVHVYRRVLFHYGLLVLHILRVHQTEDGLHD